MTALSSRLLLTGILTVAALAGGATGPRQAVAAQVTRPTSLARTRPSPLLAFTLHGDIYTMRADGSAQRRLTTYGLNSAAQLSPRGRFIAYLSVPHGYQDSTGYGRAHNVWIVHVAGGSPTRITPTDPTRDRGGLSWASDGQHLAYYQGPDVVVYSLSTHVFTTVLRPGRSVNAPYNRDSAIAWSPDSRRIAVALPDIDAFSPHMLRVAIARLDRPGASALITIRFPAGLLGHTDRPPGSFPTGAGLAWAPDDHHLVCGTTGNGAGGSLTGVWQVAQSGGTAHLLIGTPTYVRQHTSPRPPVRGATSFLYSPDHHLVALDPDAGLWVARASNLRGHIIRLGIPVTGCVALHRDPGWDAAAALAHRGQR